MPTTVANAPVDRLMHHAMSVVTSDDSIRLTQATDGRERHPDDMNGQILMAVAKSDG